MSTRKGLPNNTAMLPAWRVTLATLALALEQLWPRIWPAVGIAGLFVFLSLLDAWSWLPGWLHLVCLLVALAGMAYVAYRGLQGFRWPDHNAARGRIERVSDLEHRPITTLEDGLILGRDDTGSRALWELHQRRARESLKRIRVGVPHAGLARKDPRGFRATLIVLLFVSLGVAGPEWSYRLASALSPDLLGEPPPPPELTAWIAPPAYTGKAPVFLAGKKVQSEPQDDLGSEPQQPRQERIFDVPEGSEFLARLHGNVVAPIIRVNRRDTPFEALDNDNRQIKLKIEAGDRIAVMDETRELASWPIRVVPDETPEIDFAESPGRTERLALRVAYEAEDDYGLVRAALRIRLEEAEDELEIDLTLPGLNPLTASEMSFHDLMAHPWAGLPVTMELMAEDAVGQIGFSPPVDIVLPERIFNHPVARAVIEQRKALTVNPDDRGRVANALHALTLLPDAYYGDFVVHLSLRTSAARLLLDKTGESVPAIQEQLWETALRIEDGDVSIAERNLRDIQKKLMDALANGASDEEIERLMAELQEALDRYLQALAERAQELARQGVEPSPLSPDAQVFNRQDLQRMIDRARELSQSGARDAARQMLSQLQNLLENLRSGMARRMSPQQQRGEQAIRELGELMNRQQQLLDRTFRSGRQQGQPRQGQPNQGQRPGGDRMQQMMRDAQALAEAQEALRRMLGDVMRRIGEGQGEIPSPLGRAERSMRDARESLQNGRPGQAVGPQTDALDQLRQGARAMMQQMLRQMGRQGEGERQTGMGRPGNERDDPLGRPLPGNWDDEGRGVKVPDKADAQRARDILQELHRRARDLGRPAIERDYIDRLLKRF